MCSKYAILKIHLLRIGCVSSIAMSICSSLFYSCFLFLTTWTKKFMALLWRRKKKKKQERFQHLWHWTFSFQTHGLSQGCGWYTEKYCNYPFMMPGSVPYPKGRLRCIPLVFQMYSWNRIHFIFCIPKMYSSAWNTNILFSNLNFGFQLVFQLESSQPEMYSKCLPPHGIQIFCIPIHVLIS